MPNGSNSRLGLFLHLGSEPALIGVAKGSHILQTVQRAATRSLTDHFMTAVSTVVSDSGHSLTDLNFITLTQGPGRYTSVRIGVVTGNTLGQVLDIPVYALSTLAAYVWEQHMHDGVYLSVLKTRHTWHTAQLFKVYRGQVSPLSQDFLWDISTLSHVVSQFRADIHVVGDYDPALLELSPHFCPCPGAITLNGLLQFSSFQDGPPSSKFIQPLYAHPPVL